MGPKKEGIGIAPLDERRQIMHVVRGRHHEMLGVGDDAIDASHVRKLER
jgi:hypothetical protein